MAAQIQVDVGLVNVVATVTDSAGRYVPDLSSKDFVIEEDGQVQKISHFSHSADLPASIGIVIDSSASMQHRIDAATRGVERFVRTVHADDDIFLMTFSNRPVILQDFTSNRLSIGVALRWVAVGGQTALYTALNDSLRKLWRGKHDKKAILLITDGQDTASAISFDQASTSVRESGFLIYCLGIASRDAPPFLPLAGPFSNGKQLAQDIQKSASWPRPPDTDIVDMNVLNRFAGASGGKAWLISSASMEKGGSEIQTVLDEIALELRSQYSLGYYPPHLLKDGKWHRIAVRVKNSEYSVRTRGEYFGQ